MENAEIVTNLEPRPVARSIPSWAWIASLAAVGFGFAFWPLFKYLPTIWFADDTYYAHGVVIPICSGLIVWDRWPKLRQLSVRGETWAILPLAAALYVLWFALRSDMHTFEAGLLIVVLAIAVLFVAGWRWLLGLSIPIVYLAFGLPMWNHLIDAYTLKSQMASTDLSFVILKMVGLAPFRVDASTIQMDHFTLDVGVACSGMKLMLAVTAISTFFAIVAKLKWWGNLVLFATILPLSLLLNSLRIAMIGWVGNSWGSDAGHQFHDWSGYISLVICFLILMKITRWLGWK